MHNSSPSITAQTSNILAYIFSAQCPLNFSITVLAVRNDMKKAISLAIPNQKATYNCCHQPLFMTVNKWALLQLYKKYDISTIAGGTKKLTQQYVGPFYIIEKLDWLAYKLDVQLNWRIHPVFSVAQLEPPQLSVENIFTRSLPSKPPHLFVKDNNDRLKSF